MESQEIKEKPNKPPSKVKQMLNRAAVVIWVSYFLSYALLSCLGGYMYVPSGQYRPYIWARDDSLVWQPLWGRFFLWRDVNGNWDISPRSDIAGCHFAPLILLDQWLVHRSVRILDVNGKPLPHGATLETSLHPVQKLIEATWQKYEAKYERQMAAAERQGDKAKLKQLREQRRKEVYEELKDIR